MNELFRRILFLPDQASTVAENTDKLHYFVIAVTMAGATLVALVALWFIVRYGGRKAHEPAITARIHAPLWLETLFVGGLLGLYLTWFQLGYQQYVRVMTPPADAMEVYVVGKQWMWKFDSPEGATSLHALYVPAGRPVKLLITSRDVIHSVFIPDFRVKMDAIPGRYTVAWFEAPRPGRHQLLCTEYCGTSHSQMLADVIVLAPADYERWLAGRAPPVAAGADPADLADVGRSVAAAQGCLRCHTVDGTPHLGPTWRDAYGAVRELADGTRLVVDEAYITESIMDPQAKLVPGFQEVMPSYQGLLAAPEVAAIVEYVKSLSRAGRPRRTGAAQGEPGR